MASILPAGMLVGRTAELARLRALAEGAAAGRSGVLVVTGEPGIGKTALLRAAAEEAGVRVLRAAGVESESELPFAGLHELLRPVLELTGRLAERQARALRAALAEGGEADRFAVSAAVLSLLAEAAPVLAVVDDAQWLDGASADALAFAARRLEAEGVALLVGLRAGAASPLARFDELRLGPLPVADARALATRSGAGDVERAVQAAAGNPLAVVELMAGGEPGERLFGPRLARLESGAATAVLVAALSDDASAEPVLAAAAALGVTLDDWEAAEEAGVVELEPGRVRFRHPLLRAAVQAAPRARRAAHRALAEALEARGEPDRAAWHRAAAAVAPDETVAAALEAAAGDYARRSGHLAAARALEAAARQSPDGEQRARRLVLAAETAQRAARGDWAGELAQEALGLARDGGLRARAELVEAHLETWRGSTSAAFHRYLGVAATDDAELAALALGCAAGVAVVAGDTAGALAAVERAAEDLERLPEPTAIAVRESLGTVLALRGETAAARVELEAVAAWHEAHPEQPGAEYVAQALLWLGEHARARGLLERVIAQARRRGGVAVLSEALTIRAALGYRTGEGAAAAADADEAVRLAEDTGQPVQLAYSLALLAVLLAPRGDEAARAHAARGSGLAQRHGLRVIGEYTAFALGALELAGGRPEGALAHLEPLVAAVTTAEPAVLFWQPDLIEAAVEAGRPELAAAALGTLAAQAEHTGGAWARGAAARGRGLTGEEAAFAAAVALHEGLPFELARTRLCFGERLRRAGRRVDARAQLRAALDAFERLGAEPWAERA